MPVINRYAGGIDWPEVGCGESLWDEVEAMPRALYSTHDACIMLGGIDHKTLQRWAKAAGIVPGADPIDKRVAVWTHGQLRAMADLRHRQLGKPPAESDTSRMRRLEAELNATRGEVAELRRMLEGHLAGHLETAHHEIEAGSLDSVGDQPIARRTRRDTVQLVQSRHDTLPPGWVAASRFAHDHSQPWRTVQSHITQGLLPKPHDGPYKQGRVSGIMHVWDEEQQAEVLRIWRQRGRLPTDAS